MCFSILRITYKNGEKENIETKDDDDQRVRIDEIRGRPLVQKIRVLKSIRVIEKTEMWIDSDEVSRAISREPALLHEPQTRTLKRGAPA
jgi:hypothetical protein